MSNLRIPRRTILQAAGAAALALPALARAQGAAVRIGYTMSRTGPWTTGAQVSQEPNYLLWAEQVNAAGGLNVKGTKRPVELVSSDDRSDIETVVRTYEKLMGSDKVDLVLPPWGSGANFAVAPLANRFGYPFLAPTALSRRLIEMKLPYFFLMLQQPKPMCEALVDMFKAHGVKTVAVLYTDELFGLENYAAFKVALQSSGIQMVEDKSFPTGTKDLAPVLRAIKDKNPDAFVGFTYPPDTILASRQSKEIGFNPKFFYTSVGTAFQLYRNVMQAGAEGRAGHGQLERQDQPRRQGLLRRPREEVRRRQGARPLGQRRHLGIVGDPELGGGQGGAGPQGDPRLRGRHRAQHHPGQDQVRRQRERGHAGHRQPVAEGRVRGGVAQGQCHRAADHRQAGLGLTSDCMSFGTWSELIASGLITGGLYALIALGLNLQYGLMRVLNIAHGEFLMLGAFRHLGGAQRLGRVAAADDPGVVCAADGAGAAGAPPGLSAPDAHQPHAGHLRGARPDGQLRADVPGAELRADGVGR